MLDERDKGGEGRDQCVSMIVWTLPVEKQTREVMWGTKRDRVVNVIEIPGHSPDNKQIWLL